MALPDGTDDVAVATAAAAEGVVVFPGRPWFPAEAPGPFLRLTYAAARARRARRGRSPAGQGAALSTRSETDKTGGRARGAMQS